MPKIIHYRQKCIGCGICQEGKPEFWRMSKKDGKEVLLQTQQKKKRVELEVGCPGKVVKVV